VKFLPFQRLIERIFLPSMMPVPDRTLLTERSCTEPFLLAGPDIRNNTPSRQR